MQAQYNPLGLDGIDFVEFAGSAKDYAETVFLDFGFSKLRALPNEDVTYYNQNDLHFILNLEKDSYAGTFAAQHGPCISSMGWRVKDARLAFESAVKRGARAYEGSDKTLDLPAIYGIGDSLIYFVDTYGEKGTVFDQWFEPLEQQILVPQRGFLSVDHMTNNVYKGTMETWANFYKEIFGFTEVRFFDIKGKKTGLHSYALQSPCGKFCIPINEGTEHASQIEEYLREYDGPGVQHLAFLSNDLLASLDAMKGSSIQTLDIGADYYETIFDRVPGVREDPKRIEDHQVLVDGDDDGYLLQIFTQNLFGPIFIELIQRCNHRSFGEGNFQALFDSIERDQERRGVL